MRLLLIAYEFPPSPSPQSLRWAYLCRELASMGHELHVLTPMLGGETPGLPPPHPDVRVHRTWAGPFRGFLAMRRERRHRERNDTAAVSQTDSTTPIKPPRSWKQTLWDRLQSLAAQAIFPDLRGEWKYWGRRELDRLLDEFQPDVVISSHEPATTLELGLHAKRKGFPWVADLGDPVLAGYTPTRWARRSMALESKVCAAADHVFTTNSGAMKLLRQRHGRERRISIITQGFDDRIVRQAAPDVSGERPFLDLLYTGSFYRFRKPNALLSALDAFPHVRLSIAAITVPEVILRIARERPQQIRLLGFLPHAVALERQRNADVLVNIANDDPTQVPGKFYEYLGSGRPILHLGDSDAIGEWLCREARGWVVENNHDAITQWLHETCAAKRESRLEHGLKLDMGSVARFSWRHLAGDLSRTLESVSRQTSHR